MTLAVLELLKICLQFGFFIEFDSKKDRKITLRYLYDKIQQMLNSGFDVSCNDEEKYLKQKLGSEFFSEMLKNDAVEDDCEPPRIPSI